MQKKKSQNIIPISLDYEQDLIVHAGYECTAIYLIQLPTSPSL